MVALEKAGGSEGATMTQLYYELNRSLKRELDVLETKTDAASKTRRDETRQSYAKFLEALVQSKSGHSFESLRFGGESLLQLGQAKEALTAFDTILKDFHSPTASEATQNALVRVRLQRAEALRRDKQFDAAQQGLDEVRKQNPRLLETMMEQGLLYEDRAAGEAKYGNYAYNHWKNLSAQLERGRPRRIEYYEAQYHAALALVGLKQKTQAAQILRGVMTLSPTVGSPAMKAKYEALLNRLSK